ncbi:hypothetical protein T03_11749 [Trichinella britovi]|uniref:Uncharacterized protein n=1 Tax=Trichinella britovi TaxID=45882 RepID=A0A0V1CUU9_TRIBR|nr:hypothetical protein T03_11749 [Trichinella britovi]
MKGENIVAFTSLEIRNQEGRGKVYILEGFCGNCLSLLINSQDVVSEQAQMVYNSDAVRDKENQEQMLFG